MSPVIMSNKMISRLPDGRPGNYSHTTTLRIPGIIKQASQIHILSKTKTAPLISLGVLWDDGSTITLDKPYMSVQKNGHKIIKSTRENKNGML